MSAGRGTVLPAPPWVAGTWRSEAPRGQRQVLLCRCGPGWGPAWGAGARASPWSSPGQGHGTERRSDAGELPARLQGPGVPGDAGGRSPVGVCLGPRAHSSSPGPGQKCSAAPRRPSPPVRALLKAPAGERSDAEPKDAECTFQSSLLGGLPWVIWSREADLGGAWAQGGWVLHGTVPGSVLAGSQGSSPTRAG